MQWYKSVGIIGWSITIPTLAGLAIGVWADSSFGHSIFWTPVLLMVGLITGCFNGWYWFNQELKKPKH